MPNLNQNLRISDRKLRLVITIEAVPSLVVPYTPCNQHFEHPYRVSSLQARPFCTQAGFQ